MKITLHPSGHITLPAQIRRELGIKAGTHLDIEVNISTQRIILTPITRELIHSLRGKYVGLGLMKALMAGKKGEREA